MWIAKKEEIVVGQCIKFKLLFETEPLTFGRTSTLLQTNHDFRQFFIKQLADAPFTSYRWECPAVTAQTLDRPFEFVLIDDPHLARRRPNMTAFQQHFQQVPSDGVVSFSNLGGDAVMVVPEPASADVDFGHLGAFCRNASQSQQHELWRTVGEAMEARINDKPVWLSTAGGGVTWLHVRLDDRPKYYRHQPYRGL
ncbi:MAG: hypothetical protein AB8G95_16995 [Anaerolineae bacterium]